MDNKETIDKFMKEHPNKWYSIRQLMDYTNIARSVVAKSLRILSDRDDNYVCKIDEKRIEICDIFYRYSNYKRVMKQYCYCTEE